MPPSAPISSDTGQADFSFALSKITCLPSRELCLAFSGGLFISGAAILITLAATVGLSIASGGALPILGIVLLSAGALGSSLIKGHDYYLFKKENKSGSDDDSTPLLVNKWKGV